MFEEKFKSLSRSDKQQFSEVVSDLLYQCYVTRRIYDRKSHMFVANPDYLFLERNESIIEEYLSYLDIQLSPSEQDGVFFLTSGADKNHLRLDSVTTLIVYALRSYYEGEVSKSPEQPEVMMTYGQLAALLQELGLSNVSKHISSTSIASSLRTLDSFNIVNRARGTYSDPSYSFFILPSIRFVISNEKMNALYSFLTEGTPDKEEGSPFFGAKAQKTEESEENEKELPGEANVTSEEKTDEEEKTPAPEASSTDADVPFGGSN